MDSRQFEIYVKAGDVFVGREREIVQALSSLERMSLKSIVNITGPGGIGKTKFVSRIGNELRARGIVVTDVIDFYDTKNQTELGFITSLAKAFERQAFAEYFDSLSDYQIAATEEKTSLYKRAIDTFYACYTEFLKHTPVGILMDTFDERFAKTAFAEQFIRDHLSRLLVDNVSIVIAGRQRVEHANLIGMIEYVDLSRFSLDDAKKLVHERYQILDLAYDLDDDLLLNIVEKSEGKPILINLAVDYILENGITRKLQEVLLANQSEFVRFLVVWIRDEPTPETNAILRMAVLYRRFDQELLEKTLSMRKGKGRDVFENLSRFSFIKYKPSIGVCALHDEMRDYVKEYIGLAPFDVKNVRGIAVKYYQQKIRNTKDVHERNSLIVEWVFNSFLLDPDAGFDLFCKEAEKALASNTLDLCNALLEDLLSNVQLSTSQLNYIKILKGEILLAEYQPQEATILLEELLPIFNEDKLLSCRLLYDLGRALALQGQMLKAAELVTKAHEIAVDIKELSQQRKTLNELGSIYYLAGQYVKAANYLEVVLRMSKRSKNVASIITALGVLGNVRRRQGDHNSALALCSEALELSQSRKNELDIGQSLRNIANVKRDMREYENADTLYQRALAIFRGNSDRLALARTLSEYSWCKYLVGDLDASSQLANESIALKEKYHFNNELAITYHTLFEIMQKPGTHEAKKAAYPILEKFYQLAKKYNDANMIMDGLHHLSILERDFGILEEQIKLRADEMRVYEQQGYYFPLFHSRVINILGNFAFDRKDYETAINYYKVGYKMLALLGGTATGMSMSSLFTRELQPAVDRFNTLDKDIKEIYLAPFRDWWASEGFDAAYPQIMNI